MFVGLVQKLNTGRSCLNYCHCYQKRYEKMAVMGRWWCDWKMQRVVCSSFVNFFVYKDIRRIRLRVPQMWDVVLAEVSE